MSDTDDSPSIWHQPSDLDARARLLDRRADDLAVHACDCDRWGLVEEAREARASMRDARVQSLLCVAQAHALRARSGD